MKQRILLARLSGQDIEWYERITGPEYLNWDTNEVLQFIRHLEGNYQLINFPVSDFSPIDEKGLDIIPRFYHLSDKLHPANAYLLLCQFILESKKIDETRDTYYEKLKTFCWHQIKRLEDYSFEIGQDVVVELNLYNFLNTLISTAYAFQDIPSLIKSYKKLLENFDRIFPYKFRDDIPLRNDRLIGLLEGLVNNIFQGTALHNRIIFKHPMMIKAFTDAIAYAFDDEPCLIIGETGTGKEPIAKCIHAFSRRKGKMLKTVNCGGFTDELFNAEIQGYVKGAFTGAISSKQGVFLSTSGGTVFLDEINSLPIYSQAVLLRIIQFGEVQAVGDEGRTKKADVRIICAINTDPLQLMKDGKFREDLYFRIAKGIIRVPALRDLSDGFEEIVDGFIKHQCSNKNLKIKIEVKPTAIKKLKQYNWPGNLRELENVLYRGLKRMEISNESILKPSHFDDLINTAGDKYLKIKRDYSNINYHDLRKEYLSYIHSVANGKPVQAEELTGISRATIARDWEKYGLYHTRKRHSKEKDKTT
jgi:DNA-binding NtrC family response regulator